MNFELSALLYDFVALECRAEERAPPHTHSWADVEQDTADRDKKDNIRFDIWKKSEKSWKMARIWSARWIKDNHQEVSFVTGTKWGRKVAFKCQKAAD